MTAQPLVCDGPADDRFLTPTIIESHRRRCDGSSSDTWRGGGRWGARIARHSAEFVQWALPLCNGRMVDLI